MGNSGSMHNLATAIDDHHYQSPSWTPHHHQHQHQQHSQHNHHHQSQQAYQRQPIAPQFKVLPDNVPGTRVLRTTNNGAILHNGGTLTNRKDMVSR